VQIDAAAGLLAHNILPKPIWLFQTTRSNPEKAAHRSAPLPYARKRGDAAIAGSATFGGDFPMQPKALLSIKILMGLKIVA